MQGSRSLEKMRSKTKFRDGSQPLKKQIKHIHEMQEGQDNDDIRNNGLAYRQTKTRANYTVEPVERHPNRTDRHSDGAV